MQPCRALVSGRSVGAWTHQHATRLPVGRGGYNTHWALPMRAAPSSTPPPPLQVAAGRDNKARACPARKPVKYFSFRQLPLPRPASLLPRSSSRAPALLIAKNHFSSVQLSSSFSSCVFSFSIFLYFFPLSAQMFFEPRLHVLCRQQLRCELQFPP